MKKITIIISFLLLFSSCYFKLTRHLAELNPMEYIYNFSINDVRKTVNNKFSDDKFCGIPFQVGYFGFDKNDSQITENENRNNFFLISNYWAPVGKSEMYYNWWGRLKLFPWYHIILDSISPNQTKIRIESEPKVKIGVSIEYNHGLPYRFGAYTVKVKPSTIEEYEIIKLIGEALGEKNMPEIKRAFKKR